MTLLTGALLVQCNERKESKEKSQDKVPAAATADGGNHAKGASLIGDGTCDPSATDEMNAVRTDILALPESTKTEISALTEEALTGLFKAYPLSSAAHAVRLELRIDQLRVDAAACVDPSTPAPSPLPTIVKAPPPAVPTIVMAPPPAVPTPESGLPALPPPNGLDLVDQAPAPVMVRNGDEVDLLVTQAAVDVTQGATTSSTPVSFLSVFVGTTFSSYFHRWSIRDSNNTPFMYIMTSNNTPTPRRNLVAGNYQRARFTCDRYISHWSCFIVGTVGLSSPWTFSGTDIWRPDYQEGVVPSMSAADINASFTTIRQGVPLGYARVVRVY